MKSILLPLILLSAYSFGKSTDIIGKPKITDGDTIVINDIRIRFTGSDAPESYFFGKTQTCLDAKGQEWECGKVLSIMGNIERLSSTCLRPVLCIVYVF